MAQRWPIHAPSRRPTSGRASPRNGAIESRRSEIENARGLHVRTPLDSAPYGVLKNDNDPDGDFLSCVFSATNTSLGTALIFANGRVDFIAASGQTGSVTVPYFTCTGVGCRSTTMSFASAAASLQSRCPFCRSPANRPCATFPRLRRRAPKYLAWPRAPCRP